MKKIIFQTSDECFKKNCKCVELDQKDITGRTEDNVIFFDKKYTPPLHKDCLCYLIIENNN